MIGATLCSGIGAPELAAPQIDWRLAAEIEPFPRAVLQAQFGHRPPEDHNSGEALLWDNMRTLTPQIWHRYGVPLPDLIVAGTPCQSFSIAGQRYGLGDSRGNLSLKYMEILHDIAKARTDASCIGVWENVPGVLSDKDNAFGHILGHAIGAVGPVHPPQGAGWSREGMAEGPRARAAWAVLDAQWFGLAQRRERLYLIIDIGGRIDPAQILLEPESLRGDRPAREEAQIYYPARFEDRPKGRNCRPAIAYSPVSKCLTAKAGQRCDLETETYVLEKRPLSFDCKRGHAGAAYASTSNALRASGTGGNGCDLETYVLQPTPLAFDCKAGGNTGFSIGDLAGTLRASHGGGHAAVAYDLADDLGFRARRLTPLEWERLQGLPDAHTDVIYRNKPARDAPRYKAIGNSMAVPVMAWILTRLEASFQKIGRALI